MYVHTDNSHITLPLSGDTRAICFGYPSHLPIRATRVAKDSWDGKGKMKGFDPTFEIKFLYATRPRASTHEGTNQKETISWLGSHAFSLWLFIYLFIWIFWHFFWQEGDRLHQNACWKTLQKQTNDIFPNWCQKLNSNMSKLIGLGEWVW